MEQCPDGLTATYYPEGSAGLGRLEVSASVPPFAGSGRGYFSDDDLRAFVADASVYPLPNGSRPQLSAGLDDEETVGLKVFRVTSRGQLGVEVHLAAIDCDSQSPTCGAVSSVRMLLLTSYSALEHFAAELQAAINLQSGDAYLAIDKLA